MTFAGRALLTLMATVLPVGAMAQSRVRVTAVLEFAERYDDNLFPTPTNPVRQGDFTYRIGPRLGVAYAGRRASLSARYARDAEAFAWRSELDSNRARQEAAVEAAWSPGRVLRLEAGALYEDTTMARELNLVTGLDTPRLPARRGSTHAAVTLGLGRATRIRAEHTFTSEQASGFPTVEAQVASASLQRRMRDTESATLTVSERRYAASGSATRSHVLALGWSRQVTPRARVDIKAGPRLSDDGAIGPEMSFSVHGDLRRGDVLFEYTHTEATAIGQQTRLDVQGLSVRLRQRVHRDFGIGGGPGIYQSRAHGADAIVYRATLDCEWRLARRVALTGAYTWSRQQGGLTALVLPDVTHNTFSFGLAAGSASRQGAR
jgi:hypothetical protein